MSIFGKILTGVFGNKSDRDLKEMWPKVEVINKLYSSLESLSDTEIKSRFDSVRKSLIDLLESSKAEMIEQNIDSDKIDSSLIDIENKFLNEKLPEVFAIVKDCSRRLFGSTFKVMGQDIKWEMIHYDVQLIGGISLHEGRIAEMKTGEGKTLVSTLPIILNAMSGKGVHVVTVNDYLAERDSQWMGVLYSFLGLSVGCILNQMSSVDRKEMYSRDITYGTNSQFGFDYLRDNMVLEKEEQVQRNRFFAIIDEVDSVLIDEARTPLIISGQVDAPDNQQYKQFKGSIQSIIKKQTVLINSMLSDIGDDVDIDSEDSGRILFKALRGAPKNSRLMKLMQQSGVKRLIQKTESEYLRDKKMHEIDEELFFTIDEHSNIIDLSEKGREFLSPSDPENFVIPDLGELFHDIDNNNELSKSEVLEKKDKAQALHAERSDRIHTINQLLKAYSLYEKDVQYIVQDGKVLIVDEHTGRIMHGRKFGDGLHQALEAKENVVIEKETQTMATVTIQNYFRMYNKLSGMTGTAITEANEFMQTYSLDVVEIPTFKPVIRQDHEDLIYRSKREKYSAVVNKIQELFDKKQPVLVGTTSVEESEVLSRMLRGKKVPHNVLNAKQHQKEAEIVTRAGEPGAITISTNMAGRGTDIKLKDEVINNGGLFILGTGRHESRRIDLQLRGRAGRQGDAGESIFFLSLEDDLMRLFGSDRIAKVMDRLGVEEGEVITHSMVTKSIERAQKKIEGRNFSVRKHLLEYDDVMNQQREIVYDRRDYALHGDDINKEVSNIKNEYIEQLFETFCNSNSIDDWDVQELSDQLLDTFSLNINKEDIENIEGEVAKEKIIKSIDSILEYKNDSVGGSIFEGFEKFIVLKTSEEKWRQHLHGMDQLREGIGLRAYGQKNPLIEYKREGFQMFSEMIEDTNYEILRRIFRTDLTHLENRSMTQMPKAKNIKMQHEQNDGIGFVPPPQGASQNSPVRRQKVAPIRVDQKVGRNEPCPCGSGKKYKKCHGGVN